MLCPRVCVCREFLFIVSEIVYDIFFLSGVIPDLVLFLFFMVDHYRCLLYILDIFVILNLH